MGKRVLNGYYNRVLASRYGIRSCSGVSLWGSLMFGSGTRVLMLVLVQVHCSGDPPGATCAGSCYNGAPPPPPPPGPPPSGGADTYPKISGGQQQFENHVLRAGNTEPLTTLFCWHGFQYVRVTPGSGGTTGFTGALDAIVGQAIHTNMTQARPFASPRFSPFCTRITACCYPDRVASGPHFVPGLPPGVTHSRRWAN